MTHTPPSQARWSRSAAAVLAVTAAMFLGACASSKGAPPVAEMATARASITQAEAAGAGLLAPVELLSARDKLVRADAAMQSEQFEQARRMAEQASADAELAERKARADRARQAAKELERANATLKQETGVRPIK
ncbi:MAG: hypothetical protein C0445_13295 [Polaromonas sp.]|nr:hypothetical protein [Polaromonas sp.]